MERQYGFTLIEMMVTLVLVAILVSAAVPGFQSVIQNNKVAATIGPFISAIQLARVEAIKRGRSVSLCSASDASMTTCGGVGDWGKGWIMFSDPDDTGVLASVGQRIQVHSNGKYQATVNTPMTRITFTSNGFCSSGVGQFSLSAPGCTGNHGKLLSLSTTGRLSVSATSC